MKQFILGIFAMFMVMFITSVGYASDTPQTGKAETAVSSQSDFSNLFAQADLNKEVVYETANSNIVDDIVNVSGIKVDTVNSVDDIIKKGYYYVENPPDKSWSAKDWYGYIAGIIGLGFGIFIFIRSQINKSKK